MLHYKAYADMWHSLELCHIVAEMWPSLNFPAHTDRCVKHRDVPDIHPVPGKCRVSHYSVLPGPGKIMGPSNKKKRKIF